MDDQLKVSSHCYINQSFYATVKFYAKYKYFTGFDLVLLGPSLKQGSGDETRFNLDLIQICNALDIDQNAWTVSKLLHP